MCVQVCSVMPDSYVTPWMGDCQAPLSMEFSRHEHWSGLPYRTPGDLSDPRIKPMSLASLALADSFFTTAIPIKQLCYTPENNIICQLYLNKDKTESKGFIDH